MEWPRRAGWRPPRKARGKAAGEAWRDPRTSRCLACQKKSQGNDCQPLRERITLLGTNISSQPKALLSRWFSISQGGICYCSSLEGTCETLTFTCWSLLFCPCDKCGFFFLCDFKMELVVASVFDRGTWEVRVTISLSRDLFQMTAICWYWFWNGWTMPIQAVQIRYNFSCASSWTLR